MKIGYLILSKTIIFILLTLLTQIGGLVYIISLFVSKKWNTKGRFKTLIIFIVLYTISTFVLVPSVAPIFGREKIQHSQKVSPTNYITVLLNRNYVDPKLNTVLKKTASCLKNTPIIISYLDANFPFINQFPLLPHLSHNDGKKLDISLIYETKEGNIQHEQKSISGYGVFEEPKLEEFNQIEKCFNNGYFQYDFPKYLIFGSINKEYVFSEKGTKKLIQSILTNQSIGKIFIEPHLKTRLKLKDQRLRYHGCKAVRHDDHIHIQLR